MTVNTLQEYLQVQKEPTFEGLKQYANRKVDKNDIGRTVDTLALELERIRFRYRLNTDQSLQLLTLVMEVRR